MFDLLKCERGLLAGAQKGLHVVFPSEDWDSYSLLQVRLDVHDKVERLESALQLVTVYVGAPAIAELALGVKLHVVYDEAVSTRAGVHFIALTRT